MTSFEKVPAGKLDPPRTKGPIPAIVRIVPGAAFFFAQKMGLRPKKFT